MAKVVVGRSEALFEQKRSKFLAVAVAFSDFEEELQNLRRLHPKADHIVWAYKKGDIERQNDDGEPAGTAGRVVLEVLRRRGIVDGAIVVVRYFGGIKLGAGGLRRAYAKASALVLESAHLKEWEEKRELTLSISFDIYAKVVAFLRVHSIVYEESFKEDGVSLKVWVTKEQEELMHTLPLGDGSLHTV